LARALVGIAPLVNGAVRIDGAALADWPERQLTSAIGYVPQEPTLFAGQSREYRPLLRTTAPAKASTPRSCVWRN
jgi:ABC-type protease/lipase transport system fused ATPase/permease subunit